MWKKIIFSLCLRDEVTRLSVAINPYFTIDCISSLTLDKDGSCMDGILSNLSKCYEFNLDKM